MLAADNSSWEVEGNHMPNYPNGKETLSWYTKATEKR